jgi:hypothetical protein
VRGLDFLEDFHSNYISSDATVGKMPHVDRCPPSTSVITAATRPNESGIWTRLVRRRPDPYMVIIIPPLGLVDIQAIASLTVTAPRLSLLKSKNTGMLILLGFASFMASLELFVAIMFL